MKKRMLINALIVMVTVGACAPTFNVTVGQMPGHDPASKIEAGVTTKAEVVQLFGQPDLTGADKDGLLQWTWTHLGVKATPGKEATITSFFNLEVSFEGERVKNYSYSRKAD